MPTTQKAAKPASRDEQTTEWTAEEKAAMQEHARELKAAKRGAKPEDALAEVLAKIAEMPEEDRAIAQRIHDIVLGTAPTLTPRTYYGMPAYAKDGKVLVFFQPAAKFKSRYGTLGFNDDARLDEGTMWPTSFAVTRLTEDDEARIAELVERAVG
jgi:uncharacterized protein YdhG (YjbR/CyaY superfamily)